MKKILIIITIISILVLAIPAVVHSYDRVMPQPPARYSLHYVRQGDTLWGLAERYMPDVDPRLGVEWVIDVNSLDENCIIHPGDILNVPDATGPLAEPLGPTYSSEEAARAAYQEWQKVLPGVYKH